MSYLDTGKVNCLSPKDCIRPRMFSLMGQIQVWLNNYQVSIIQNHYFSHSSQGGDTTTYFSQDCHICFLRKVDCPVCLCFLLPSCKQGSKFKRKELLMGGGGCAQRMKLPSLSVPSLILLSWTIVRVNNWRMNDLQSSLTPAGSHWSSNQ